MSDYQARFAAGTRSRTVTFKVETAQTKEQLERTAWSHLRTVTCLPADNWTLASLNRVLYRDGVSDEDGRP